MLIAAFPKHVFWPLLDWSVALLDTLRVAFSVSIPSQLGRIQD
jgi:hypothetical protein